MNEALILSAVLMGLAGTPHCLAMCGAACTAVSGGGQTRLLAAFHLGRLLSYAAAGAVVAASVGSLAALGQSVAVLRPLWTLVHSAALVLGLYLLWRGHQPAWMAQLGNARAPAALAHRGQQWQTIKAPARSAGVGLAWVAWPCGLLQSALLVAALANTPVQGAAVMAAFALASGLGLVAGPILWSRLAGGRGFGLGSWALAADVWAVRLAGLMLAAASAWAMGHGAWASALAWCLA